MYVNLAPVRPNFIGKPSYPDRLHNPIEVEAYFNGFWQDLTADLLVEPSIKVSYGIAGSGPTDLVASTGTLSFALNNSEFNSAKVLGYWSIANSNHAVGWKLGIPVRISFRLNPKDIPYVKMIGRLKSVKTSPGKYRDRKVVCLVTDWIDEAANAKINLPAQINKRGDELMNLILDKVALPLNSRTFDVGDSTFPFAFDNNRFEGSPALSLIGGVCASEFSRFYIRGGYGFGNDARWEKRSARLVPVAKATFLGTFQTLSQSDDVSKIKNHAITTSHPRRVDTLATTVLFSKPDNNNPSVAPGKTIRITGRYVDPANPNARVGGKDMAAPVSGTDYAMFQNQDGTGTNLTANFTVVADFGANQVIYDITNGGGTPGFITKLQAKGRGLYDYDPLDTDIVNQSSGDGSIDQIGDNVVKLDMIYQADAAIGRVVAEFIVDTWSVTGAAEAEIQFIPRNTAETQIAWELEPGDPIAIVEEVTGINNMYYIQSVDVEIREPDHQYTTYRWSLQRVLVQDYWQLGTVGFSELGVSTILAPL